MIWSIIVYLVFLALIFALLEIQIEGENGWAKNLPTWRLEKKWLMKLTDHKPITGYHFLMNLFLFFVFHGIFLFIPWRCPLEFLVLAAYIFFFTLEDFLWFVFNPAFGLKKFSSNNPDLWWHKTWCCGLPLGYWLGFLMIIILVYLGFSNF